MIALPLLCNEGDLLAAQYFWALPSLSVGGDGDRLRHVSCYLILPTTDKPTVGDDGRRWEDFDRGLLAAEADGGVTAVKGQSYALDRRAARCPCKASD